MPVFVLESQVKPYAWGAAGAISKVLGHEPTCALEAELWMGAHPLGPSSLVTPLPGIENLEQLIASDREGMLGHQDDGSGSLPFLFKVLAAAQPLSLQAHPTAQQARAGFQKEEKAGVPRDSAVRLYKDDSHKPELICALTEFSVLSGFREARERLFIVEAFGLGEGDDALASLLSAFRASGGEDVRPFFCGLFDLDRAPRKAAIQRAVERARSQNLPEGMAEVGAWVERLAVLHPEDAGVLASLLLNLVTLKPGEAIYLPAGNLHSYLQGVGLEVMASSDNVLRGGLTKKHVDVKELTRVLNFKPYAPEVLRGQVEAPSPSGSARVARFSTPAKEFELSFVNAVEQSFATSGPELWLILEGQVEVLEPGVQRQTFGQGKQIFLPASQRVRVSGTFRIARVIVPASGHAVLT